MEELRYDLAGDETVSHEPGGEMRTIVQFSLLLLVLPIAVPWCVIYTGFTLGQSWATQLVEYCSDE